MDTPDRFPEGPAHADPARTDAPAGIRPGTTLRTGRLGLVPLAERHAEELAAALADPALHAFTGGAPLAPEAMRARCARLAAGSPDPGVVWANRVVRLRGAGHLVGTVQATIFPARGEAEVAWVIGTPWQGRGFATEAARALCAWLAELPVGRIAAYVHPDHHASAAVAAACGLAPVPGALRDGEVRWERVTRA
jgi:RimJ/RimL family protein N-acetyltransferase